MKKYILLFFVIFQSTDSLTQNRFEIDSEFDIHPSYTGVQGVEILKVYVKSKKEKGSLEMAKKNVVQAIIFKGISGSGSASPILKVSDLDEKSNIFFNSFFANKDYLRFVNTANDGSINFGDFKKVGKYFRIGYYLKVEKAQLRSYLEDNGIIRKLGF
jgi:hypothetical protein